MNPIDPIPFTDEYGQPCLRVPLSNAPGLFALVDPHDFATLQAQGLTGPWLLNGNGTGKRYVRTTVPTAGRSGRTLLLVARLIVGAGPGTVVRYDNGNSLDLRFVNLAHRKGKAGRTDATLLADAVRLRADRGRSVPPNHTATNSKDTHALA